MVAMGGGLSVSPYTRPRAGARMSITGKMGTHRHHRHPAEGVSSGQARRNPLQTAPSATLGLAARRHAGPRQAALPLP